MPVVAAANPILTTFQQLWTLVLAWPGLTQSVSPATTPLAKPRNLYRFDVPGVNWPEEAKSRRNVADSVELKLEIGNTRPDPILGQRTFCNQPQVNITEFIWSVTVADHTYNVLTQAVAELKAAMVAAGPQLGLAGTVLKWEQAMRPGKQDVKDRQLVLVISVTIRG